MIVAQPFQMFVLVKQDLGPVYPTRLCLPDTRFFQDNHGGTEDSVFVIYSTVSVFQYQSCLYAILSASTKIISPKVLLLQACNLSLHQTIGTMYGM